MISKTMKAILHALSYGNIELESSRRMADLKQLDAMRIFVKKLDARVYNGEHEIPVRLYFPTEEAMQAGIVEGNTFPILLFFHGGGWVTESVENYDRVCARMAQATAHIVVSVEYRLAPEHPFPTGFMDCYAVAKAIYTNRFILNVNPQRITLIGDSAGGNLAAAVSLKARDDGIFKPQRQILIYPAVNNDYSGTSRFQSVKDCGSDYLLTAGKMRDYIDFYAAREEDKKNKYFAPLMETDYRTQPDTLILTAEFDPLRDEGEEYGKRLKEAGNYVEVHRIKDALHGYFALGIRYFHVQESFELINQFLSRRE